MNIYREMPNRLNKRYANVPHHWGIWIMIVCEDGDLGHCHGFQGGSWTDPEPGTGPPGKMSIPQVFKGQVMEWIHASNSTCQWQEEQKNDRDRDPFQGTELCGFVKKKSSDGKDSHRTSHPQQHNYRVWSRPT